MTHAARMIKNSGSVIKEAIKNQTFDWTGSDVPIPENELQHDIFTVQGQ